MLEVEKNFKSEIEGIRNDNQTNSEKIQTINEELAATQLEVCYLKTQISEQVDEKTTTQLNQIECNQYDKVFGIALPLSAPNFHVKSQWSGKNLLGSLLVSVREDREQNK